MTNFLPVFLVRNRKKRYALPIKQAPCAPESEGGQSVPDMDKVVQMSRLFSVTTDFLLKDELSDAEKETVKAGIKEGLEGLIGKVPGLLEVHVHTNGLPTSNADVMLDTTLESFEALKGYAVHPEHVAVATTKVRPYFKTRTCMDFEV